MSPGSSPRTRARNKPASQKKTSCPCTATRLRRAGIRPAQGLEDPAEASLLSRQDDSARQGDRSYSEPRASGHDGRMKAPCLTGCRQYRGRERIVAGLVREFGAQQGRTAPTAGNSVQTDHHALLVYMSILGLKHRDRVLAEGGAWRCRTRRPTNRIRGLTADRGCLPAARPPSAPACTGSADSFAGPTLSGFATPNAPSWSVTSSGRS